MATVITVPTTTWASVATAADAVLQNTGQRNLLVSYALTAGAPDVAARGFVLRKTDIYLFPASTGEDLFVRSESDGGDAEVTIAVML